MTVVASILLWLGIIALGLGIYLCLMGGRHVTYNIELENKNEQLQKQYTALQNEIKSLKEQQKQIFNEQKTAAENYCEILDFTYNSKEKEFDAKIDNLQQEYENKLLKEQQQFNSALEKYVENLDKAYTSKEKEFDTQLAAISTAIQQHQEELNKIQDTYKATIEARLREEEIAQQQDYYSLQLTPNEESTIALIEELKPRLPEPRVLCMLVWQTFYQKKLKTLCANVLHKATSVCGIYKITNKNNGLCYVGQAVDVAKRWSEHAKAGLGIDTPAQNKLYQAMLKDGLSNFTFELLEECDRSLLNEKEKFYINLYQSCDYGYNSTSGNR